MFAAATTRSLARASAVNPALANRLLTATASAPVRGYATPAGPPPPGFRQKPYPRWEDDKESTLDKLGRYFLLTEMFRGMYVLLEQFFRPPYTIYYPFEKVSIFFFPPCQRRRTDEKQERRKYCTREHLN